MTSRRLILATATSVAAMAFAGGTAMAKEYRVDDAVVQCKNADFTSIQAAVDAAAANPGKDKIKVCPGLYQEQVRITGNDNDGLKLEADKKTKLDLSTTADPTKEAIIQFPTTPLPNPRALVLVSGTQDVGVSGFRITGPYFFSGCAERIDRTYGVRVDQGGSLQLDHNRITEIRNSDPALRGCQNGVAVQVGRLLVDDNQVVLENTTGTAQIDHNLIDKYEKNGPTVDNTGSFAQIDHNEIYGNGVDPLVAQNGLQVGRGAGAKVDHNLIVDNNYTNPIPALDNQASGIIAFDYGTLQVDHNDLLRNDTGLYLDGENGVFSDNDAFDGVWGIYAESSSSGNNINHNEARRNSDTDCTDTSAGSGTAGTANTWKDDKGDTQNRPGLCKP